MTSILLLKLQRGRGADSWWGRGCELHFIVVRVNLDRVGQVSPHWVSRRWRVAVCCAAVRTRSVSWRYNVAAVRVCCRTNVSWRWKDGLKTMMIEMGRVLNSHFDLRPFAMRFQWTSRHCFWQCCWQINHLSCSIRKKQLAGVTILLWTINIHGNPTKNYKSRRENTPFISIDWSAARKVEL